MSALSSKGAEFLIRSRLADAEAGDVDALFELGVTFSTGRGGMEVDLVEAHKWFNLAALSGSSRNAPDIHRTAIAGARGAEIRPASASAAAAAASPTRAEISM